MTITTITLTNYEEYFLLLADNELSPAEETQVKGFAAQHPHLQEELDLLMACRLDAVDMPTFPKEKLLRTTTWDVENPEPIHTQLISLLDNELPAMQMESLKQQIAASPALQTEWNILQQTKLRVEVIVYPDKNELYRQHKIRPLVWVRWAAAAAVFAIAWLFWPKDNNIKLPAGLASAISTVPSSVSTPVQSDKVNINNPVSTKPSDDTFLTVPTPTQQKGVDIVLQKHSKNTWTTIAPDKKNTAQVKNDTKLVIKEEVKIHEPETLPTNEPDIATLGSNNSLTATLSNPEDITVQMARFTPKNISTASESFPNTLAANTLATDEEEFVHIAGARIDKQKMRGLFRGITRSVARTFSKSKMTPAESAYATRN